MFYVERDADDNVIGLFLKPTASAAEALSFDHPDILAFLSPEHHQDDDAQDLLLSDLSMARVIEDLIEILINKNVLMLTELPEAAQTKILTRKSIRDKFAKVRDDLT